MTGHCHSCPYNLRPNGPRTARRRSPAHFRRRPRCARPGVPSRTAAGAGRHPPVPILSSYLLGTPPPTLLGGAMTDRLRHASSFPSCLSLCLTDQYRKCSWGCPVADQSRLTERARWWRLDLGNEGRVAKCRRLARQMVRFSATPQTRYRSRPQTASCRWCARW